MNIRTLFFFATVALYGCGGSDQPEPAKAAQTPELQASSTSLNGAELYQTACASCHEGGVQKAPHKMSLK